MGNKLQIPLQKAKRRHITHVRKSLAKIRKAFSNLNAAPADLLLQSDKCLGTVTQPVFYQPTT